MLYSADQMRAASIAAKCSGSLSALGSSTILWDIWRHHYQGKSNDFKPPIFLQILMGMSILDICSSSMYIVGSWAIPPENASDTVFQPRGTDTFCTVQGALFQACEPAIPLYNLSLAVYYFLSINCHSWTPAKLQQYAWAFHVCPVLFGFSTAIFGVAANQFHPNEFWCWFAGTEESDLLKFLLYYGPLWTAFATVVTLFVLIHRHVRNQEKVSQRYLFEHYLAAAAEKVDTESSDTSTRTLSHSFKAMRNSLSIRQSQRTAQVEEKRAASRLSRPIFIQGLMFSFAFLVAFMFPTVARSQQLHKENVKFSILFCMSLLLPLQGFMNCLVYFKREIADFVLRRPLTDRSSLDSPSRTKQCCSSHVADSRRTSSALCRSSWSLQSSLRGSATTMEIGSGTFAAAEGQEKSSSCRHAPPSLAEQCNDPEIATQFQTGKDPCPLPEQEHEPVDTVVDSAPAPLALITMPTIEEKEEEYYEESTEFVEEHEQEKVTSEEQGGSETSTQPQTEKSCSLLLVEQVGKERNAETFHAKAPPVSLASSTAGCDVDRGGAGMRREYRFGANGE
ncbi:hypothetical protein ACA910_004433 [Epithemia clementina (nom. ined.)]